MLATPTPGHAPPPRPAKAKHKPDAALNEIDHKITKVSSSVETARPELMKKCCHLLRLAHMILTSFIALQAKAKGWDQLAKAVKSYASMNCCRKRDGSLVEPWDVPVREKNGKVAFLLGATAAAGSSILTSLRLTQSSLLPRLVNEDPDCWGQVADSVKRLERAFDPDRLKLDSAFPPSEVGKMRTQVVGGKRPTLQTA
ncbi:hypothetical protein L345_13829, partial [Ophiophagus hannah]